MSSNKESEGSLEEEVDDMEEKTSTYNELESKSTSTKGGHMTVIRQWNLFAQEQRYPLWDALTEKDVCGTVHENGSLADQHNPPLRKMMAEYASYLLQYTFEEHGKKKYYKTKVVAQKFNTLKSGFFERFKPLGYSGKLPDWYSDLLSALKEKDTNSS